MKAKNYRKEKVQLITLGCSKNLVDSEQLMTQLDHNEYHVEHNPDHSKLADIIIINTCGFIDRAKEESIDTILHYAALRKEGKISKLLVTGCLSHRYKDNLEVEIPEVDGYFGTMEMPTLLARLNADYKYELIGERLTSTPSHFAYLKISEGCNRTCSFCAIPLMRGKHVSVEIDQLVKQAQNFAKNGVKELILIAQELTYYGLDLYKKRALPELLDRLCEVEGIEWIRLHYSYPSKFPLDVIHTMNKQSKVCNYLDIPLQHATDRMLLAMKRQINKKETVELIQSIRQIIPDISLRTTMLVGFPGETEDDFEELCEFIKEHKFDRLGVFQYSHEEDTSAHDLADSVSSEIKEYRAQRLMQIQEDISYELNEKKRGKKYKVIIDRVEGEYFIGRTEGDSPEVDNEVLISAKQYVRIGDFVDVIIRDSTHFDLIGEVV
ncbi:MAG: 30S ribosomal protein S12 methylthiotransferase RimO [Saprospiraceae bacterium]|uniref:Ribosomal protein uS12 methylthiotransferase RimO n=1 Tax=Candidatus Defluviibacterium haderslevense TaxID=2981993 RepID=A0A9D7SC05_9BACT|nr:30S ribosomal protein S12 methylthiotransferase RimO [Candidatus Defluviibacterium haderslevense]